MRNKATYNLLVIPILYILINPFLALFVSIFFFKNTFKFQLINGFFFSMAFAFLFFSREFGVQFYDFATDDVEVYIEYFKSFSNLNFSAYLELFLSNPSGNEPIYLLLVKLLDIISFHSLSVFLFFHYWLLFALLYYLISKIKSKNTPHLILFYFLLFPITLYSIAHIWRQQLAVLLFYILLLNKENIKSRFWFGVILFSTIFIHLSNLYFILGYLFYFVLSKIIDGSFNRIILASISLIVIEKLLFLSFIYILSLLGLEKLLSYAEGFSADKSMFFILLPFYIILFLITFYLNKRDQSIFPISFIVLTTLMMPLVIPTLNSIYDRFVNFTIPFIGLFLSKYIVERYNRTILILSSIVVLLVGSFRLYTEYLNSVGVISFIGYKQGFDPTLGMIKLLLMNLEWI